MLEVDARGRLKRNGWAAGRVGSPLTELLPLEEELVELWEGVRARARGVASDLFVVSGSVNAPDPPIVMALAMFRAPEGSEKTSRELSFSLIGLEKDLQKIYSDVQLDQEVIDGKLIPVFGLMVRVSDAERLPYATEAMERIAQAVRDTRIGEFVEEPER